MILVCQADVESFDLLCCKHKDGAPFFGLLHPDTGSSSVARSYLYSPTSVLLMPRNLGDRYGHIDSSFFARKHREILLCEWIKLVSGIAARRNKHIIIGLIKNRDENDCLAHIPPHPIRSRCVYRPYAGTALRVNAL